METNNKLKYISSDKNIRFGWMMIYRFMDNVKTYMNKNVLESETDMNKENIKEILRYIGNGINKILEQIEEKKEE